jgi:hypothetical protein
MYNTDKIDYNDYMFKQIYTSVVGGLATKSPTNSQIDEHQLVGVAMTLTQKAYGALQDKIEWQNLRKKFEQPIHQHDSTYVEPSFWNTKNNYPFNLPTGNISYGQWRSPLDPSWTPATGTSSSTTTFTASSAYVPKPDSYQSINNAVKNQHSEFKISEDTKTQLDKIMESLNKTMLSTPSTYDYMKPCCPDTLSTAAYTQDEYRAMTDTQPLSALFKQPDPSPVTKKIDLEQVLEKLNQLSVRIDSMEKKPDTKEKKSLYRVFGKKK